MKTLNKNLPVQVQQKVTEMTSTFSSKTPSLAVLKSDMVELIKKLEKVEMELWVGAVLKNIESLYQGILHKECHVALDKFKASGGDEHDFVMRPLSLDIEFQDRLGKVHKKFGVWHKSYREKKRKALAAKRALYSQLRSLINGEVSFSFDALKDIQHKWKQVEEFPSSEFDKLRASYHALIDRCYSHRSIYFELKQLDAKKNLEKKLMLCEQAEKLIERDKVKDAIERLNTLHYEFKNIGSVPSEHRESVWIRFKKASNALRSKWEKQLKIFHRELEANREKKEELLKAIVPFGEFASTSGVEWSKKTKSILDLRQAWEQVGQVPKQYTVVLQKSFWSGYKQFFDNRKKFFKELDKERLQHVEKKQDLLRRALDLKNSTDWEATARKLKELRKVWNNTGLLPRKYAIKMEEDFHNACSFFFERQREQLKEQRGERVNNFSEKMIVCEKIETASKVEQASLSELAAWVEKYNAIGPAPYEKSDELETRFNGVVNMFFDALTTMEEQEKDFRKFEIQLSALNTDLKKERKLHNKGQAIRKKIHQVEHDISVFRNNLEFFNNSKRASEIKDRLNIQLEQALIQLKGLKKQAELLKSILQ